MGGGSKSTSVTVPAWLEAAGQEALARSREVSRIPYAPYYGPDVAAMTPMQVAAMRGTNQMAEAFGSPTADVTAGMPTAQDYGGMSAYSAGPMYDAALAELQRRQPETYNAIMAQFGGTAGAGGGVGSSASATGYVPTMEPRMPQREGRDSMPAVRAPAATGTGSLGLPDPMSGNITSVGPIGRSGGGGLGGRK
jgi:hypothetical protein